MQLQCQILPLQENIKMFWIKDQNKYTVENNFSKNKFLKFINLENGYYDLLIRNVSYEHNGTYECTIISSTITYTKCINLIVLRAPNPPIILPVSALATEDQQFKLQCNTYGGNPEPEVKWYRDNNTKPFYIGKTLIIKPMREDNQAIFRCAIRNQAMREDETLNASVTLDVQYFPRVTVGPENPFKVEVNDTAILKCDVDSKPMVNMVRWWRDDNFIITNFTYIIPNVMLQDVGRYTCEADNGLGKRTNASLILDVLYPPIVSIEGETFRVANAEDSMIIHCNVIANPTPVLEWLRDGHLEFKQIGSILRLIRITPEHDGNYTCRAMNTIHPTGRERRNYSASAKITIRVQHKPGPARVIVESPVVIEDSRVILTCVASPAGYPESQYMWWKEDKGGPILTSTGPNYEIDSVHIGSEGTYKCHAMNKIGKGEAASVNLTVYQPPKMLSTLEPLITKK